MEKICIGLDIAKLTFVAAIKFSEKEKVKTFTNNIAGFKELIKWVERCSTDEFHYCMEATGKYGYKLAVFLNKNERKVSVINPAKIKFFMKSQLSRNKTDSIDAKFIRYYCELFVPEIWQPSSLIRHKLQTLVKRRDTLMKILLQEENRLENAEDIAKTSLDKHIVYLKGEIEHIEKMTADCIDHDPQLKKEEALLTSIKGIGDKTAIKILAFLGDVSRFEQAKKMAAFVGLNPQYAQSGTSLYYSHLSKTGDPALRKMFYMSALVAMRHEPSIRCFYEKLVGKGKAKKVAICAVMRKLVHIVYGVLKSQKPFDSSLICPH